jgi:hypothetical protein
MHINKVTAYEGINQANKLNNLFMKNLPSSSAATLAHTPATNKQ